MVPVRYPHTRLAKTPAPAPTTSATRVKTQPPTPTHTTQECISGIKPLHPSSDGIPRPCIPSKNDMHLLHEYNKKYLGYADYDPTAASLGKSFYDNYLLLTAIGNDISNKDSTSKTLVAPPSANALLRGTFGRPSKITHSTKKHALKPHTSWH